MGENVRWILSVAASAERVPGTPTQHEIARRRARHAEIYGRHAFDPEPPAADVDPDICRDCHSWGPSATLPDIYEWHRSAHKIRHPLHVVRRAVRKAVAR